MSDPVTQARMALAQKRRESAAQRIQSENQARMALSGNPVNLQERAQATERADRIGERDMARAAISRPEAMILGGGQGATMGFADEAMGAFGAEPETVNFYRNRLETGRKAYPGLTTASEIAGGIAATAPLAPVTGVRGAVALAGATGALDAAGRAEGSAVDRIDDAVRGAATGMFFGGLSAAATRGLSSGVQRLASRMEEKPTVEGLRAIKTAAYEAVRKSGVQFEANDMTALSNRLARLARTTRYEVDSEIQPYSAAALRSLRNRADEPITLNKLDGIRQRMWDLYNKSDEPFILEVIGEIDGLIAQKGQGNAVMLAARQANSRYSKAQLLENAFRKARLQTASTGSGGNILNKYRQAVTGILTKPHETKWFSPEEIAVMEKFVEGDVSENFLRRVGKLSPSGNGLMTALNVYAASIDPTMLAVTGAATAAKGVADSAALSGADDLVRAVGTGVMPTGPSRGSLAVPAVAGALSGNALTR